MRSPMMFLHATVSLLLCLALAGCATPGGTAPAATASSGGMTPERAYELYLQDTIEIEPAMRWASDGKLGYLAPWLRGHKAAVAGKYQAAEAAYNELLMNPDYRFELGENWATWETTAHALIGHARFQQGKMEEGVESFAKAAPGLPKLLEGDEAATSDESHLVRARLFNAYLYRTYGRALEALDRREEAVAQYERAAALGDATAGAVVASLTTRTEATLASKDEALARASDAERAGRADEALRLYSKALLASISAHEGAWFDPDIAARAIHAALDSAPPPVPEAARQEAFSAHAAFQEARQPEDLDGVIARYVHAIGIAPWWADAYVNLALVLEQRQRFEAAASALELYLMAAPDAADAQAARARISELRKKAPAPVQGI